MTRRLYSIIFLFLGFSLGAAFYSETKKPKEEEAVNYQKHYASTLDLYDTQDAEVAVIDLDETNRRTFITGKNLSIAYNKDRKFLGYRLKNISSDSTAYQAGLRNDQTIIHINNIELSRARSIIHIQSYLKESDILDLSLITDDIEKPFKKRIAFNISKRHKTY